MENQAWFEVSFSETVCWLGTDLSRTLMQQTGREDLIYSISILKNWEQTHHNRQTARLNSRQRIIYMYVYTRKKESTKQEPNKPRVDMEMSWLRNFVLKKVYV